MTEDRYNFPIINTIELFPIINNALIELLESLSNTDWEKETVVPGRSVKDLAAHIIDGSFRRLSMCRDNYNSNIPDITCYADLVDHIQQMNKNWIKTFKIVSPKLIISLLKFSEPELYKYLSTLKTEDKAIFPVAWAGENESTNWFDIAREYTEKWHHQMQIRLAVNKPGIDSTQLFYPVIDTFMRGLPHVYQSSQAENGSNIAITVTGKAGGEWFIEEFQQNWRLSKKMTSSPIAKITMSDSIVWRLFTGSIDPNIAKEEAKIEGEEALVIPMFKYKAVMR
jgi:hypothetical protein